MHYVEVCRHIGAVLGAAYYWFLPGPVQAATPSVYLSFSEICDRSKHHPANMRRWPIINPTLGERLMCQAHNQNVGSMLDDSTSA